MNITDIPSAVLLMNYRIARLPLQVIEVHLVSRLGDESPARLFYERSLGTLDVTVGNVLGDSALAEQGAALAERSDARRMAAALEAEAGQELRQANQEFSATRERSDRKKQAARADRSAATVEARRTAQERKTEAAQNVRQRTTAAKKTADKVAAERAGAVNDARREEQAHIDAAQQTVVDDAKAKLGDAADKRAEASATRSQANRLDALADAEKAQRRNGSA